MWIHVCYLRMKYLTYWNKHYLQKIYIKNMLLQPHIWGNISSGSIWWWNNRRHATHILSAPGVNLQVCNHIKLLMNHHLQQNCVISSQQQPPVCMCVRARVHAKELTKFFHKIPKQWWGEVFPKSIVEPNTKCSVSWCV